MLASLSPDGPLDPLQLDHALRGAADYWGRWCGSLREQPSAQAEGLNALKTVSNRELWQRIVDLPEQVPIRERLMAWVYRLMEQRVNAGALCTLLAERQEVPRAFETPARGLRTLAQGWHAALRELTRLDAWLAAMAERGQVLGDATVWLWQRRAEFAQRLSVESPQRFESPCNDNLVGAAQHWLSATEALWREQPSGTLALLLTSALGCEAASGWPVQLNHQALAGWFRGTRLFEEVTVGDFELPRALGAASFVKSLELLGRHWHHAAAPRNQPFCVAFDPFELRGHALGAGFAGLLLNPEFLRRHLGLSGGTLAAERRILARVVLIESRVRCFKVLLRSELGQSVTQLREAFEAVGFECFRVPVPQGLTGQLWRPGLEDLARYAGMFMGGQRIAQLIESHDQDWFRNPRALEQLRADVAMPPETKLDMPDLLRAQERLHAELAHCLQ